MARATASVLEKFNAPLEVRSYPLPDKLEPGAALVSTEMAGICGTDVHLWRGELPIQLPVILGHETVGRLVQMGAGLERDWTGQDLRLGDRVTWNSTVSCGCCYYCTKKGQPTRCPERRAYGIGYRCDQPPHFWGGYGEFHYLRPGTTLFKLPEDLAVESVVGAGCALITALHGVERICVENRELAGAGGGGRAGGALLPEAWREWVVIQGAGPVGLAALAVAQRAGATRTIVIGGPRQRLEIARRFGAEHTIDLEEMREPKDRIERVRALTGGYGADVVLECVGRPAVVNEGMEMCRDGGKYLVLGHYCDAGPVMFNPQIITRKQLQVFGSWSSEPRHLRAAIEFLQSERERFPFHALITHRYTVAQANEALAATARWESAKSVIVPGPLRS